MPTMLTRRTSTIPIYQGDDEERLAELRMAQAIAERNVTFVRERLIAAEATSSSDRYGDDPDVTSEDLAEAEAEARAAREAFQAFVTEAAERAVPVVVQHIGRKRFRELVNAHPARFARDSEGKVIRDADGDEVIHPEDYHFGVDTEKFSRALLAYVDEDDGELRTILEPDLSGRKLDRFLDVELPEGAFDRVWKAAYWLNRGPSADPKALLLSQSTDETDG